jgi:ribosomal protein L11 methyltransferase
MASGAPDKVDASAVQTAYRWVRTARHKMTASTLELRLRRRFSCSRTEARRVIRALVNDGRLAYVNLYGQSYIDLGLHCPTPISRHVILYPPGCTETAPNDAVGIVIEPGAAFGDGRHPTTRLAIAGLEAIPALADRHSRSALSRGIDIGTGSGILAIAAARLGVAYLDALDIDPCARNEARRNIALNHLGHRINLRRKRLENMHADYDLILANLRLPTLCKLVAWVQAHSHPSSYLVFSGFRDNEQAVLQRAYAAPGFRTIWSQAQAGWGGLLITVA